ncbi:MAG: type II secretion system protein [Minisyncoccales bacterium]
MSLSNQHLKQKGFTLMELLVVVAIIGLLAAIVMTNVITPRKKAHDAKGEAEIRQIMTAFQLKYSDDGVYPRLTNENASSAVDIPEHNTSLQPYLDVVPTSNGWAKYQWYGNEQQFCLLFKYETKKSKEGYDYYYTCSHINCQVRTEPTCDWEQ